MYYDSHTNNTQVITVSKHKHRSGSQVAFAVYFVGELLLRMAVLGRIQKLWLFLSRGVSAIEQLSS